MVDSRGQAMSIEALFAAFIIVTSLTLAFNVTVITESPSETKINKHTQLQDRSSLSSLLETASERGTLKPTILYWDDSTDSFHNTSGEPYYTEKLPPTEFGSGIATAIRSNSTNVNIELIHWSDTEAGERQKSVTPVVQQGDPDGSAIVAEYTVLLHEDDVLYTEDGTKSNTKLTDSTGFYASNSAKSGIYNLVNVRVIVWQD